MEQKNISTMQKLLNFVQGFKPKAEMPAVSIASETEEYLPDSTTLFKLIELAVRDNKFLKTEGVLRLSANEVKKNKALSNIDHFFLNYKKDPDYSLLGMLLKTYFRTSMINEQKNQLLLDIGLEQEDIDIGFLSKPKMEELTQKLKSTPPKFNTDIPQLSHFIYLCQKIAHHDEINKMTPNNIAVCIASSLLPTFGKMATRAFEKNICLLLQIVLEHWIKKAETGVKDPSCNKSERLDDASEGSYS